jgi:phosphopantothenoylcysteine synthetase/decarboxylase
LTFNTLNKFAAGISDTYALGVLNEALGAGQLVVAVPMINEQLWGHPALRPHISLLAAAGVSFLDPHTGLSGGAPVRSGTGPEIAAAFDPAWLLPHLRSSPAA